MGLRIFCPDDTVPVPRPVFMELICDGDDHGLLPAEMVFREGGVIEQLGAAMRAGWKETYTGDGEKRWLGPCCSGKKVST